MNEKYQDIYCDNIYIEYQKKYYKKLKFSEVLLRGYDIYNNKIEYPVTLTKSENLKFLNSYNNPIFLDDLNLNTETYNDFLKKLYDISSKENVDVVQFKKKFNENSLNSMLNINKKHVEFIGIEKNIDLNESLESIKKNFSKGHKSALKIDYNNLKYELIDKNNYRKNQIFEMMDLHKKISGRSTRSRETWEINEKMILENKGLLLSVKEGLKTISYTFIFFNKNTSIYFSSCSIREKFKLYKNITHKVIWKVIKHMKSIKCQKFSLGLAKTLYSKNTIDQKEKNISLFKSSFGGDKTYYTIYNSIPKL